MQDIFGFAIMVIVISASGVMSPGPLFSANIIYGIKEGKTAGLKIAIGHTIVEFPLIILLGTGICNYWCNRIIWFCRFTNQITVSEKFSKEYKI